MPRSLSAQEIRKAARAAVNALEENDLKCCLFGSAACAAYGMTNRVPNDVDIVVLTDMDEEDVKDLIVDTDDHFFLVRPKDPNATFMKLFYSFSYGRNARRCKIDILTPLKPDLWIPKIPHGRITYVQRFNDLPLMPFLALLLMKLRGWTDHRDDHREYMQMKQPNDEVDIEELLEIAPTHEQDLRTEGWMPQWFVKEARERVAEFVEKFPDSAESWEEMGFKAY